MSTQKKHYYRHICPLRRRQKSEHVQEIELNKYYLNKSHKNHIYKSFKHSDDH